MASPSSLTTRVGLVPQVAKATYVTTGVQLTRATRFESMPAFDYVENENTMLGVHERATSAQSIAEKSSLSVPVSMDLLLYPKSLAQLLFGIGFVPGTATGTAPAYTHKLVKSNQADAPYITVYNRLGSGAQRFHRQIQDVRLSQMVISLGGGGRGGGGATVTAQGMGLKETGIADGGYTTVNEADTQFLPFLGGMLWDTTVVGGSDYNFGTPREHVITFDRPIEEDDQLLHNYYRNDNQEMSFGLSGQMRGLEFGLDIYNELYYGGVGTIVAASPSVVVVLTGLTMELNTSRNIPTGSVPYKFTLNIPKCEIRATNFAASGNELIRADVQWRMIDDALTPPARIELVNDVASYPYNNALFTAAGGSAWTLPDPTP